MARPTISTRAGARRVPMAMAALFIGIAVGAAGQTAVPNGAEASARGRMAIEAAFARADVDGDGKLSRDEAARMPEIAARFDGLDKDKDGFLSFEEFAAGAAVAVN